MFLAGIKVGVPISQLIAHDLSKLKSSFIHIYTRHWDWKRFHPNDADRSEEWLSAVNRHQKTSRHHNQYWEGRDIPDRYIREMAADLMGATRNYSGSWPSNLKHWSWWRKHSNELEISKEDREKLLEYILNIMYSK